MTPLIDRLQAATFTNDTTMQWVEDKYALRNVLRKAHCFTMDEATSSLVSDFSVAVAGNLDETRQLAIPPFPTTWFEIDNIARLKRVKELGIPLTKTASMEDVVPVVGWLITSPAPDEHCLTYCCEIGQGIFVPPLSYHWSTKESVSDKPETMTQSTYQKTREVFSRLLFGVPDSKIALSQAWIEPAKFQSTKYFEPGLTHVRRQEMELMLEISGELRHLFGLLLALSAGDLGAKASMAPQPLPSEPPIIAKGKTLLPLEHKVLTIKLAKHTNPTKVTARAVTGVQKRRHDVRGHWRILKNADGTLRKRVPVKAHERGNELLGRITKDYKVER